MVYKTFKRRVVEGLVVSVMALFLINANLTIPRRPPPPPATVAIIQDSNLDTAHLNLDTGLINIMVAKAIDSALGMGGITNLVHSGNTVLIKPNLVTNQLSAITDWRVVRALVNVIKTASPAKIIIAEASALNNTFTIMNTFGYTSTNFPDVTLVDLNDTITYPLNDYTLTDGLIGKVQKMAAIIYNADVFITVPRMKTHGHCGITGALKNIGVGAPPFIIWNVPGVNNNKGGMHHDIRREIVEHVMCRVPDFALMDGIQPMQGNGPSGGTLLPMKLVVASRDPVALDAVACNIMEIPPFLITHQVLSANKNIGTMDMSKITVVGNTIASVQYPFTRAVASSPILPSEPGSIPYRATTVIRPARQTMIIDGDLSEWGYANTITANAAYQVNGSGTWSGPADCSFNAKFLYDAQNLYVAVVVRDDKKLPNPNTGSAIRNGECVELYLSTYPTQFNTISRATTYNPQYDYCMGISYAANPQTYMFSHGIPTTGVVASEAETSDGYIIEAQIPWSNFANVLLDSVYLRELGINLAVDDADNNPTIVDHKILWTNDAAIETNPIKMGVAYLDPAGGLYLNAFTLKLTSTNGTVATSPSQMWYDSNTVVQLTATPNAGYTFTGWSNDASGSTNPLSVTMNGNKDIMANFTVNAPTQFSITLTSTNGTIAKSPDQTSYDSNTVVQLMANANPGYTFTGWGGDTSGSTNPLNVTLKRNRNITATFTIKQYSITLTSTNGTIAKSPDQTLYDSNTVVQLMANANPGYTFTGWSGDAVGSTNPLSLTMNGNKGIAANFTISSITQFSITLSSTNGTIAKSPNQTSYDSNTIVLLTAMPNTGYTFTGWGGDASGSTSPVNVTMNGNKSITATFAIKQYSISLTSTNGTVVKNPDQALYDSNFVVAITATPNAGYTFTGWSGGATGLSNPMNVTMNGNKNITANFAIKQYSITLTSANGTVAKNPNLSLYDSNTVVALLATPNAGYTFSSWGGDASGTTNTASVTMNGNKNVIANFTIKQFSITVTSANGTVAKNPNLSLYDSNTVVALTATPNTGYTFTGWTGGVTGSSNPVNVTMNGNKNITANFSSTGLPSPWATQDIGSVSPAGSATWAADSFTVKGSGADIWSAADAFRFVSQSLAGDATIIARVASQSNSNGWAKSGIMFRESLTAGSKHVMLVVTPSNGVDLQYRATTNGSSTTVGAGTGITAPIWLKLVHSGSTFTAYRSTDGTNWTQAATLTQTMVSPLYTGLCVTSHANGTLCTTIFKNVSATVVVTNNPPTIATASSATPSPVTASTTSLSVLGADDNGEANLTYTWATTGTPPAAVTFSANGTNAAKNSTATFTKAGSYNFQVTVKDQGNLTVTSSIAVSVNQTPTSIVVSPASATVALSATQQFTAAQRDQFGTNLTTQPTFTWSVSGGGTISTGGLFTAGTTAGGPYTVTAQSGTFSGTGSVTVSSGSTTVYQINSGGSAASPFTADQYYSGGTASSTTSAITTTGVTNPAPQAVYQSERYGTFSYTLPGLVVGGQYTVRLHFAEIYWTASGKRTFNVVINGTTVLTNYDIFAAAGGQYRAVVREFTATADAQGRIVINFNTVVNNAKSSGIEIIRQ